MKNVCTPIAILILLTVTSPVTAQAPSPKFGLALNLTLPMGEFNSQSGTAFDSNSNTTYRYRAGYDAGLGAQFWLSFPVDQRMAFRFVLGGQSHQGEDRVVGGTQADTIYLRHRMFSIGGDAQIFLDSAFRHRGTYLIGGLSADFERFERSYDDFSYDYDYYYDEYYPQDIYTESKTRLGANFGIGHSFGYHSGIRFTLEATYHKTLTGNDQHNGEPINADFMRLSFGMVF